MPSILGHELWRATLETLAKKNELGHGYIFFGPEGVGKRQVALSLASYLETGIFEARGAILIDASLREPSGGTLGIDEIRDVKAFLGQTPLRSPRRTVIIDNAETLTIQAQNALLKTAEEPPPHALIILIVRDYELLFPTLVSRLSRLYFAPLQKEVIHEWCLKGGASAKEAERAAALSRGAPGRAWRILRDEKFQALVRLGDQLLVTPWSERKALLKEYLESEEADVLQLIETLIVLTDLQLEKPLPFLKSALTLKREAATFNLNPRLQLENLLSLIP